MSGASRTATVLGAREDGSEVSAAMTVSTAGRGGTDRSQGGAGSAVSAAVAERDDELRAALSVVEVTAGVLSRDRDRLSSRDVDELMDGLIAEIGRLRSLVDHS